MPEPCERTLGSVADDEACKAVLDRVYPLMCEIASGNETADREKPRGQTRTTDDISALGPETQEQSSTGPGEAQVSDKGGRKPNVAVAGTCGTQEVRR